MILKTSKGTSHVITFGDVGLNGGLHIHIANDPRPLSHIAAELEGCEWLERIDHHEGNKTFAGYSRLTSISAHAGGAMVKLERGLNNE